MEVLNKCSCGKYTNYGSACINCSVITRNGDTEREVIDVDFESLFTDYDIEIETDAQTASKDQDSPDELNLPQESHPQEEEASHEDE